MFDLGTSFLASAARDPHALAIVDGEMRLSYRDWYAKVSALVAGFDRLGLQPGDHIVTALQNRWEAATLHWACQLAGLVITPINWRAKSDEIDFYLSDSRAVAIAYQDVSGEAVAKSGVARGLCRMAVGLPDSAGAVPFAQMIADVGAEPGIFGSARPALVDETPLRLIEPGLLGGQPARVTQLRFILARCGQRRGNAVGREGHTDLPPPVGRHLLERGRQARCIGGDE